MHYPLLPALALLLAAGPSPPPPGTPPPARVDACLLGTWNIAPFGAERIRVRLTASGGLRVREVRMRVDWGDGKHSRLVDAGDYPGGSTVTHELPFEILGPFSAQTVASVSVVVTDVLVADGRAWSGEGPGTACAVAY